MFMLRKKKNGGNEEEYTDAAEVAGENDKATVTNPETGKTDTDESQSQEEPDESDWADEAAGNDKAEETAGSDKTEEAAENDKMMEAFEAWLADADMDGESLESAKAAMTKVSDSLMSGEFDDVFFDLIAKGSDYTRAVEEAELAGEVKGRNAKIEELRESIVDDGLPHPGASGGGAVPGRTPSIFDLAREAY